MPPVQPADAEGYETRVATAVDALDAFQSRLVGELDDKNGAFAWWSGHSDWKTLTLLADYLIQSVGGVPDALTLASFAAFNHRGATFADTDYMRRAQRNGVSAFPLNAQSRRRHLTITQTQEACFYHLGQTLDRLAAAVIVVGGFEVKDVAKLDWRTLTEIEGDLTGGSTKQILQPLNSKGRAAQLALVQPVADWQQSGPTDWLPWLRGTRNNMTHRAQTGKLTVTTKDGRFARLFYREPLWSQVQSLVFGSRPPKRAFIDSFVMEASEDILDGLCGSVANLVAALTKTMVACWDNRTSDPMMIIQHGKQWPVVEPTSALNFSGYGNPVILAKNPVMAVNPLDARRWEAARVLDDRRKDWY